MTLVELSQRLGDGARIKLVWNSQDGWMLAVSTSDGRTWATKTRDSDLDTTFARCVAALDAQRNKELS